MSMDRRTFLRNSACGVAAMAAVWPGRRWFPPDVSGAATTNSRPNILVVMVDQMRDPQWFPEQSQLDTLLPNMARLRTGAVNFTNHYAAATACTPSRACMLTGLYTHQHFCIVTEGSHLHPDFPTWGDYLRQFGYATHWFGKWHLSEDCDGAAPPYTYLEPYGFATYTCPDPHGAPGQGLDTDDDIARQFATWLGNATAPAQPWCATVSFVNPHDIMFYPRFTQHISGEDNPPSVFTELPPNFETPTQLASRSKPALQRELVEVANRQFGLMRHSGPGYADEWVKMLDTYLQLHQYVDAQIGAVLDALDANPAVRDNTVVIFTCDHGDFCGSHGLRGKGGAVYEESIRVPFYVRDFSGTLGAQPGDRTQLTSHIDLAALLMTIGYGGSGWRTLPECSHLAQRFDMLDIVRNPSAAGRAYTLHTTDEPGTEEKTGVDYQPFNTAVANHVACYRTAAGKLATYNFWTENTVDNAAEGEEVECYDYATPNGRLEIDNITDDANPLYAQLYAALMDDVYANELRAPLPAALEAAQNAARTQYLTDIGQLGYRSFLPHVEK
ncbi:MAG: sulfatase-like hydrolase/transferase [Caldilinea sp.]|nr:sulfatase-like hydrolase/transferase [Caldilinea sp.]